MWPPRSPGSPAHRADQHAAARWFLLPGSFVAWRASGEVAVDPSNASSAMLLDVNTGGWSDEACAAFGIDPATLAPVRPADTVLGPVAPWLRDAAGLDPRRWSCSAAATRWRRRSAPAWSTPGAVCDVMGTAEPVCAVAPGPALDPEGVTELHPHADPGGWLLENPGWLSGGAYRWFRDELGSVEAARAAATGADVYELLNDLAAGVPAGADGVLWVPALAGAMAPEWNADARAGWFGLTAAHGRAHMARALLEGNAYALRDVLEAMGAAGLARPSSSASPAARRATCCARSGPTSPASRSPGPTTSRRPRAAPPCWPPPARGCIPTRARRRRRWPARGSSRCSPDPERRGLYDGLHARHRALYSALRPLFWQ